jgi:hypothetical protein
MQVHVLQHAFFEGLGSIEPLLHYQRAEITYTRLFESPHLPEDRKNKRLGAVTPPFFCGPLKRPTFKM